MTRIYAILASLFIVFLLGGIGLFAVFAPGGGKYATCLGAGEVAGGDIGGSFALVDHTGAPTTSAEAIDRPSLVYFGYTYCPDVCPFDVSRNLEAAELLLSKGVDARVVFITVDPERDTPGVLADYAYNMGGPIVPLTGSAEQIRKAAQAYRVYYGRRGEGADDYLIDHSTFTYLMLPGGEFAGFFRRDVSPESIADRAACIVREANIL